MHDPREAGECIRIELAASSQRMARPRHEAQRLGAQRLGEIIDRYGTETVEASVDSMIDYAARRFREEVLSDRRNRFFSAYMSKAKQKMKIEVNREALQRAVS